MSSYHITMHRCINLTAGAVGRFENPEGMGWMRTFGGDCFSPITTKNLEGLEGNSPPGSDGPSLN